MDASIFTDGDRKQLGGAGISIDEALRQIDLFENPPGYADLVRPCVPGDGIRVLDEKDIEEALAAYERARQGGRFLKFVPASGAATRMFQALLWFLNEERDFTRDEIEEKARLGEGHFPELARFLGGLSRFAFRQELESALGAGGHDLAALAAEGKYRPILDALLSPGKLDHARLPKGLILFHGYDDGPRTPFEEHLIECVLYASDAGGDCRLHFTVSPEHEEGFRKLLGAGGPRREKEFGVRYDVRFSAQKPSTDTIAVDPKNALFRDDDGRLLLRPGGHGALIENLNDLGGDVVFIKNIDNVSPAQLRPEVYGWKKALAGHLVAIQEEAFRLRSALDESGDGDAVDKALRFLLRTFSVTPPSGKEFRSDEERRAFIIEKLDRPIRVCGMVVNAGDPGGGPFWVRGEDGAVSLQIVESAQIDPRSEGQVSILKGSTHFNPVDLVCGVRDREGGQYDLLRHVDPKAVFISGKSKGGRSLKALERPGLWNGAMADWNTVFVEVPPETFSPVKQVTDLLKEEHRG